MWQICADTSWGMLYFNIKDFSIGKPQTWALGMTGTVFAMLAVRHFLSWRILSLVVPVFNRNGKKNKQRQVWCSVTMPLPSSRVCVRSQVVDWKNKPWGHHVCFADAKTKIYSEVKVQTGSWLYGHMQTDTKIKTHASQTGCLMSQVEINGQLMQLNSNWGTILSHSVSHDQSSQWETGKAIDLSAPCRHKHHLSRDKSFFELGSTFIAWGWEVLLRYPIEARPHRPSNSQLEIQVQTKGAPPGSVIFLISLLFSILSMFTPRGAFKVQMFTPQLVIWITLGSLESWIWYVLQKRTNKFMWDQPYFHWPLLFKSWCFRWSFVLRPQCS